MKNFVRIRILIGALTLNVAFCLIASAETVDKEHTSYTKSKRSLVYKPRSDTSVPVRLDPGVRGTANIAPTVYVLSPDHVGFTIQSKPTLYWYQSGTSTLPCELTISRDDRVDPVLQVNRNDDTTKGIKKLQLTDYDIALEKGVQYRWFTALIADEENRSRDIVAGGMIERIDPPQSVAKHLIAKNTEDLVYIMAEEGIWYDALDFINKLNSGESSNSHYQDLLAEMLDQGNLPLVAAYVRNLEPSE